MRESFITSVPDESGAFLKAVTIFTSLGLNIVRTSYNKAVDQHMIFLEAEGDEEGISKARVQLKKIGYLTKEEKEEVVLLEFLLPDRVGTLEKVLKLIERMGINISYISSVSDNSGWQNYRMGLFVKSDEEKESFLAEARKLYMVRTIEYGRLERSYDNAIFYSGFVAQMARMTEVKEEKKGLLMVSANMAMEILDSQGLSPQETFSSIAHFTTLLAKGRGEGFRPRITRETIRPGYSLILIEPPSGSNTALIVHGSSLLAIDSGYALYRKEMEALFDSLLPEWRDMDRTMFLTHADVDHGGLFPLFPKIVTSKRSKEDLVRECNGLDGYREENRLHRPYILMCKILTHYSLPEIDKVEAIGEDGDFSSSAIVETGKWKWEELSFTLLEGKGGHLKGESILLDEEDGIIFTGDVWVNLKDMTPEQSEYNTVAPVLMTSVDTNPDYSREERRELLAMLKPGMRVFPGHGGIKRI